MNFNDFLQLEIEAINRYKWLESEKAGHNIGFQRAAFEWVAKHASQFREYYYKEMD